MPTVLRQAGMDWRIFTNDHPPPHVHVKTSSGMVKIALDGQASIIGNTTAKIGDVRQARKITLDNEDYLLQEWDRIHNIS